MVVSNQFTVISWLSNGEVMAAVAWTVGNVNPGEIMLVDGLVNGQVESSHERIELAVGMWVAGSFV